MFTLIVILFIVGVSIGAGLFVGSLFSQGYIYSEPSPHLPWTAPVAALVLIVFFAIWCLLTVMFGPAESPYHIPWIFSPTASQFPEPVKELWALRKGGKTERYLYKKHVVFRGQTRAEYHSADTNLPWNGTGVEAIVIRSNDVEYRYNLNVPESKREQGAYRAFVSADGWIITEYDSPSDNPQKFRMGRVFLFLFVHAFHLLLWCICLWLVLRFQWAHALVGGFVIWVMATLILVPMLIDQAAEIARARQRPVPISEIRIQIAEFRSNSAI